MRYGKGMCSFHLLIYQQRANAIYLTEAVSPPRVSLGRFTAGFCAWQQPTKSPSSLTTASTSYLLRYGFTLPALGCTADLTSKNQPQPAAKLKHCTHFASSHTARIPHSAMRFPIEATRVAARSRRKPQTCDEPRTRECSRE